MGRLELNANGGIWEVTDVQTPGLTLTPDNNQPLTSPVTVSGNATATAGTTGTIKILDHLYKESGNSEAWGSNPATRPVTFSKPVPYSVSFKGGAQEGVIMLSVTNTSTPMPTAIALEKVLLSA
jgi:hypothetical protein